LFVLEEEWNDGILVVHMGLRHMQKRASQNSPF